MNLAETHDLLTFAASIDNRKFDDATVVAWQSILATVNAADATAAVRDHFAASTEYLMPAHVRVGALGIARRRHEETEREQRRLAAESAGPLKDRSAEIQAFVRGERFALPAGDPGKLRPRDAAWRRRERVEHDAEPNPYYRPGAVLDQCTEGAAIEPESEVA